MSRKPQQQNPPTLYTVAQFVERHPFLTVASLRWQIYRGHDLGLDCAFVRIGRRVFVDEARYFAAVAKNNGQVAA